MDKIIEVKNLIKKYGENTILNNISFDIEKGEVVSLIGPSGSGKSSILRSIVDLEEITSGEILIEGYDIKDKKNDSNIKKKMLLKTGMVFQTFNLFPHITVGNNIVKTLKIVKKNTDENAKNKAKKMLELVGLLDKFDSYPNELSGGQKQRIAIARALALEPDIMLFDEPTSALDPELVKEVLDIIRKLKKQKITMLIVSHEMNFVKEISDKIIVLEKGEILETGISEVIFNNAKSERVRQFLNSEY